MIARILLVAIAAGMIAGAFATIAQAVRVQPLILEAETYELAAPAKPAVAAKTTKKSSAETTEHSHDKDAAKGHSHGDENAWGPADGFERTAYTFLSNVLLGIGFSMVLTAAIMTAGMELTLKTGVIWGLAGFGVFTIAPAMGLPPEMPGMIAADIYDRIIWWGASVICAGIGLAVLVFKEPIAFKVLGLGVIALPHIIGAPHIEIHPDLSSVPAELAVQFVMASLFTTGLFWIVLGASVGGLMQRFGKAA